MEIPWENIIKILASFVAGGLLGYEREYRDKPAGLRTLIMISVGSTLFSIISLSIGSNSPDRIASNIVTGVGFVGAGVIFKEGINVHGITTAATIWIAAAVGMALGVGAYTLAVVTLVLVFVALTALSTLEATIDERIHTLMVKLSYNRADYSFQQIEEEFRKLDISFTRQLLSREEAIMYVAYKIVVTSKKQQSVLTYFTDTPQLKSFEL
jgi:putative Mg2+ transporter-C (MgtC) family protein